METKEPLIRDISDTACWAAWYRAYETSREDAVFRDPFALKLAGERGKEIARKVKFSTKHSWSWVARTYLFDHLILEQIGLGVDMVVNLACGLDTRPLRMCLPTHLQWIEVDLPSVLDYKEALLGREKSECRFERVRADLSDVNARRELFARLGSRAKNVLILSEGLITYFTEDEVKQFALDLAAQPSFQRWLTDLGTPALIKMLNEKMGKELAAAGSPLKFGPEQGPRFFEPYGWTPLKASSMLHCAEKIKRLPWMMRPWALLPDTKGLKPNQPWSGAVLLGRK